MRETHGPQALVKSMGQKKGFHSLLGLLSPSEKTAYKMGVTKMGVTVPTS